MRKYPITNKDGVVNIASHIGINYLSDGYIISDNASSYARDFDNDDVVFLEMENGNSRYCTIGKISEAYRLMKLEIIGRNPGNLGDYAICVLNTVNGYLGDVSRANRRSTFFPTEKEIAQSSKVMGCVSDLAHQNAACGIERAMLSQNLLLELGIKSVFKTSAATINDKVFTHGYNLISNDGHYYIFDATIPTIKNDKISPIICEIPEEVYNCLIMPNNDIGYSVLVSHYNSLQKEEINITYDAGRENVYKVDKAYTK